MKKIIFVCFALLVATQAQAISVDVSVILGDISNVGDAAALVVIAILGVSVVLKLLKEVFGGGGGKGVGGNTTPRQNHQQQNHNQPPPNFGNY